MTPPPEQARQPDAMPFRLTCVPHPDPNDAKTAQAIQQVSDEYDALADIAGTAPDGTLLSYSVATHDPETARKLQAFVSGLKAEQEDQS